MSHPLNIDTDPVLARQQDFMNSLDHFCNTAKSFADSVEGTSAFWQGDTRMAAFTKGLDLHAKLNDLHQWGVRLVEAIGGNVAAMHSNEHDGRQAFYAVDGGDSALNA